MKTRLIMALVMIGILLATGACSSTQGTNGLDSKIWKLESYGEQGILRKVLEGTEITATLDRSEGRVHGSSGCNTYGGEYRIDNNQLTITELAYTEMACSGPEGIMQQEEQYLGALPAAESYEIGDGKLKITSGEQLLIYKEFDSDILQGLVRIGPITPVEKPGEKPPIPSEVYEARKIMVYDKSGKNLIKQLAIDGEGRYVANLKPGTYTVDINHIGVDSSDDVPKQVVIQSGITTRLDIAIDTGIR